MTTVAWVTISLTDLYSYLVAAQVDAMDTAALKTSPAQTDRFTIAYHDVVNRIRVKIKSKLGNRVSATPYTVPPAMKWIACMLIIEQLTAAVPGLDLDDDQRRRIEDAKAELNRVADGKDQVEAPTDPEDVDIQANQLATVITPNTEKRTMTRTWMAGL